MTLKPAFVALSAVCFVAVACGGGDDGEEQLGGKTGTSGAGGGVAGKAGSAGQAAGSGGATSGSGGVAGVGGSSVGGSGSGGSSAGSGGVTGGKGGTGGSTAGAGGSKAGSGGATGGSAGKAGAGGSAAGSGGSKAGSGGSSAGAAGNTSGGSGGGVVTPPPTVTPGAADHVLLLGAIVTPDEAYDGEVLVVNDKIFCVGAGTPCSGLPEAVGATVITTNGVIAPGLIDTHNHILFDVFDDDDWIPLQAYDDHDDWPKEARYGAMLDVKQCLEDASQGKPAWCPAKWNGTANSLKCELDKWGELKGMIAGTTSIVGLPGTSSACFGSLSRSVDASQNDLGVDSVQTSALFPPSGAAANGVCANFADGDTTAYLIHCGEGITGGGADNEFATLNTVSTPDGCLLAKQTAITHGTAFTQANFQTMVDAGMKLTWSPRSNWALYGKTTDIPAALSVKDAMGNGLVISLGPDWSMGGSVNMLDEMRFAAKWDDDHFGNLLTSKDILRMATINGAKVVSYDDRIGQLKAGYMADLFVVPGSLATAYDDILAARPKDVRAVMIGGKILYGDPALKVAAPANPGCEDLDVCGVGRFVCVAEADTANKLNQTHADIKAVLEAAMTEVDTISGAQWKFAPLAPLVNCSR